MTLTLIQLVVTSYLCGLIWVIQLVHYPLFRFVSAEQGSAAHTFHQSRMTLVVAPAMILELVLAGILLELWPVWIAYVNLMSVVLIWLLTFLVSVPIHNRLLRQHDSQWIHRLILTNWPRTVLWTLRVLGLVVVGI